MRKILAVLGLIIGFYLISACGLSDDTVAKVGKQTITVDDYKFVLNRRFPGKAIAKIDSAQRYSILNYMIDKYLQANQAIDMGLDTTRLFLSELADYKARLIGNKYFEKVIVDVLVPEEEIREAFEKRRDEVKARHILIQYKGARNSKVKRSKEEAFKLAEKILREAKSGKTSFNYLAEKYSDDPSAKKNKGDLGYFTWGQMVDEFQKAAFSMEPGQISEPVETPYGFHIIKVEGRRKNPFFDENNYQWQKEDIKRNRYFAHQDTALKMWKAKKKELKQVYEATLFKEKIDSVARLASKKQQEGRYKPKSYSMAEKRIVLAKWKNGQLFLDDVFLMYGGRRFSALQRRITRPEKFEQIVDQILLAKLIENEASKIGLFDDVQVKTNLKDFKIQKLSSLAYSKEVKAKSEPTEEEIKAYYEQHADEFVKPAEIELWEISLKDEKTANKVLKLAQKGYDFEKLAGKYSEDKYYKKKKGYIGFKTKNRRGEVSKEAFKLGTNKIGGPVKYRNYYVVFKTGKIHPETIRSFEEAYQQVKMRVRNKKLKERREEWLKELKDRYAVKINHKVVDNLQ
ncbi:MAG: peptidylprolyl isomerase [Caldisericaceae bacterium]|nr:peptidylprolyl isomerase [Caldisericaceae bacterium]